MPDEDGNPTEVEVEEAAERLWASEERTRAAEERVRGEGYGD
jgi:hypothetical protein